MTTPPSGPSEPSGLWGWDTPPDPSTAQSPPPRDLPRAEVPPPHPFSAPPPPPRPPQPPQSPPQSPQPPATTEQWRVPPLARRPAASTGRPVVIAVVALVALLGAGGVYLAVRPSGASSAALSPHVSTPAPDGAITSDGANPPPDTTTETTDSGTTTDTTSDTTSDTTTEATGSDTASDPQEQARSQLQALRQDTLRTLVLQGQWAAQLASKYEGVTDPRQTTTSGSNTFYAADILAEHQQLAAADNLGATVVLVLSTDYGHRQLSPDGQPIWVTFAVSPSFASEDDVNAWCARRFPGLGGDDLANTCVAHRLLPP